MEAKVTVTQSYKLVLDLTQYELATLVEDLEELKKGEGLYASTEALLKALVEHKAK